ncbi:hypothetical protein [Oceanimonas baumannii]|uniref:prealbumin-like fold domain-containing protein n=1 Tax=Oceanimonas baumannii TaxID=129578 RepID=UPI003A91D93C
MHRFITKTKTTPWWLSLFLLIAAAWPAQAVDDPEGLQFTLSACRQEAGDIIPSGDPLIAPICEDGAYTTGNLGKLWAELDLVPHRLILTKQKNDPNQIYRVVVSGDNELSSGLIGWDNITVPVINTDKSSASCQIMDVGPVSYAGGAVGGVEQIVYRYIDIKHDSATTCVLDYAQRLSITSAGFSGSSLQSQLLKQDLSSIGQRTLSLPVADILPQEISKEMTASQDIENDWNVMKSIEPVVFDFGDTCDPETPLSQDVTVKVEWTKTPTPGGVHVQTVVTATNPSSRDVLIRVTDTIFDGNTELDMVDTSIMPAADDDGFILLPANSMVPVLVHEFDAPSHVTDLNDKAVAEYKDPIFNDVTIPTEDDTATASAEIEPGNTFNDTATITDTETISDTNGALSFSVDPVTVGAFDGYTPGYKATKVVWNSGVLSNSGEVYFDKTVYIDGPAIVTDGILKDKAVLTSGEGENQIVRKAFAKTKITSGAIVELTIKKSLSDNILQGGESATFNFEVKSGDDVIKSASIELNGSSSGSTSVSGLAPGSYNVLELATTGFTTATNPQPVSINLPDCEGEVSFVNDPIKPKARVKKVTFPAGNESGWEFTLWKNGEKIEGPLATDGNGELNFTAMLGEGNYEVKEALKENWQLTGVTDPRNDNGDKICSFTVDLPDDYNGVNNSGYFTCTFENTKDARVLIRKVVQGDAWLDPDGTFDFSGDLGNFAISTTAFDTPVNSPSGYVYVTPGIEPYLVSEADPSLNNFSFKEVTCVEDGLLNSGQSGTLLRTAEIVVEPGEKVVCTFVNTKEAAPGEIIIRKITKGGTGQFAYDFTLGGFNLMTETENVPVSRVFPGVAAGLYKVEELFPFNSADGFDLVDLQCDDPNEVDGNTTDWNGVNWDGNTPSANISVDDGETVTCTFVNRKRGRIIVDKIANPSDTGQSFVFKSSYDTEDFFLKHGEKNDSGWLVPGNYKVSEIVPDGWDLTQTRCVSNGENGTDSLVNGVQNPVPIELDAGEVVRCTFTNVQRGMVDVVKTLSGNPLDDGDSFTFEIRLGDGTGQAIAAATAAGPLGAGEAVDFTCTAEGPYCMTVDGMAKFPVYNGALVQYAFCETNMDPGWQNVQVDEFGTPLDPQNWFVPGGGDPELDNSVECIAFTLEPGQTTRFYIDDVPPPGGDARTIGYWKNWTSCDGRGNQDPVMDMNLPITLYQGFSIGDSVLGEAPDGQCAIAVDLLDKRHVGILDEVRDSDKRANDAAYSLAAQYTAYLLNQNAGAYYCAKADSAAGEAAYLLMDIGFDGQGSYLPSGRKDSDLNLSPKHYKELQDLARKLAGILDSYNNNECQ